MSVAASSVLGAVLLVGRSSPPGASLRRGEGPLRDICDELFEVEDFEEAIAQLRRSPADVVVVAESLEPTQRSPGWDVEEAVRGVRRIHLVATRTPVVVVTDEPDPDLAVRFVHAGAVDYVPAPLVGDSLQRLVAAGSRNGGADRERFFHPDCPAGVPFVGHSEAVATALGHLRAVAESNCDPVLLLGETGTGKELAARAVHEVRHGPRREFVAVNCAALTANLLESELFGHVKGSFTGADRDKAGLFELAGTGTIFLDEISEMPRELQAKLLRVLQERTFRKVGGTRDIPCRATIVASSNRDLLGEVAKGGFRRDLYYRLAVFPISIPPLRSEQRRSDIALLAEYFIQTSRISKPDRARGLTREAREKLLSHDWPGNVRELRNVIDRALILEKSDRIGPDSIILDVPASRRDRGESQPPACGEFSLEAAERQFILRALKETGWQRTRAAALLGITRATLHAKLKRYDIRVPGGRRSAPAAANSSTGSPAVREACA